MLIRENDCELIISMTSVMEKIHRSIRKRDVLDNTRRCGIPLQSTDYIICIFDCTVSHNFSWTQVPPVGPDPPTCVNNTKSRDSWTANLTAAVTWAPEIGESIIERSEKIERTCTVRRWWTICFIPKGKSEINESEKMIAWWHMIAIA